MATDNESENGGRFNHNRRPLFVREVITGSIVGIWASSFILLAQELKNNNNIRLTIKTCLLGIVWVAPAVFFSAYIQVQAAVRDGLQAIRDVTHLPKPWQAGVFSSLGYMMAAMIPLSAALMTHSGWPRFAVVMTTASVGVGYFGWLGATICRISPRKIILVLIPVGWLIMLLATGMKYILKVAW